MQTVCPQFERLKWSCRPISAARCSELGSSKQSLGHCLSHPKGMGRPVAVARMSAGSSWPEASASALYCQCLQRHASPSREVHATVNTRCVQLRGGTGSPGPRRAVRWSPRWKTWHSRRRSRMHRARPRLPLHRCDNGHRRRQGSGRRTPGPAGVRRLDPARQARREPEPEDRHIGPPHRPRRAALSAAEATAATASTGHQDCGRCDPGGRPSTTATS